MGLFKRSFQSADEDEDATTEKDLFSHSNSFEKILADEARRKRESLENVERKRERKHGKEKVKIESLKAEPSGAGGVDTKRRRITSEEGKKLLSEVGLSATMPLEIEDDEEDINSLSEDTVVRKSPRLNRKMSKNSHVPSSDHPTSHLNTVQSSGEDGHGGVIVSPSRSRATGQTEPLSAQKSHDEDEDEYDSDPDIAKLQRAAREKRRKQELLVSEESPADSAPPALASEPSIKYFIESPIDGTKPLLVYRKLSQRLQELREAWVARQEIPEHLKSRIFFVNQLRKLYDITTGLDLGLKADHSGNIVKVGMEHLEGADQVHLIAVTDEILIKMKEDHFKEERKKTMLHFSSQGDEEPQTEEPAPKVCEYRIVLRAKGLQEQKLKIKPSTQISKVEWYVRKQFSVDESSKVWLEFDGERLDPNGTVEETEIATCDDGETITIDVYIR